MPKEEKRLSSQVLFWSVLGPFIILLILLISLVKASPQSLQIPLLAIAGVPLCWKWKFRGMTVAVSVLLLMLLWTYSSIPVEARFWQVGLAMAVALAYVVTALSFEEVETIVDSLQRDLDGRLENLWRLDEKLKNVQERWQYEKEDFRVRSKILQDEAEELKQNQGVHQKTSEIAYLELQNAQKEKVAAHQQVLAEQQENTKLRLKIAESEEEVRGLSSPEQSQNTAALKDAEREIERLKSEIQEKSQDETTALEEAQAEIDTLRNQMREIAAADQPEKPDHSNALSNALAEAQQEIATLREQLSQGVHSEAVAEKDRELRRTEGLYRQLREQFDEKKNVLHQTRKELFELTGKLEDLGRREKEKADRPARPSEKHLHTIIERLEEDRRSHEEEIVSLNELVEQLMNELAEKV